MSSENGSRLSHVLERYESEILLDWMKELASSGIRRDDLMKESELRQQAQDFLRLTRQAAGGGARTADIQSSAWSDVRDLLGEMSRSRASQGFTASQTATFILSFKRPLFARLRTEAGRDADALATDVLDATELLDKLGLYTTEVYQKTKEQIINRQQQDMLELSTPVVKLWEGVLALPMIGTLDSARTQVVMETLLQRIVETGAEIAIIDITGVPTVDTLVAQHLLKTVTAARLMGADCIISGIRPQIAQTIVHLGVNLGDITTKATLADALTLALQRVGFTVKKPQV
jgi:rsbT co-antagonist protein RsbR